MARPAAEGAQNWAGRVKAKARALGFDLVGITTAEGSRYRDYLRQWLDDGQAGTMNYLANRCAERTDPATYLPGAQSIICVAINYHAQLKPPPSEQGVPGRIARYALGDDYHEIIKDRLHELADWLRAHDVDEVDVVGIATDYCVHATAADAARAGFGTRVLLGLTAGVAPDSTAKAIEDLRTLNVSLTGTPAGTS